MNSLRKDSIAAALCAVFCLFSSAANAQAGVSWTQATSDAGWGGRNEQTTLVYNGKLWILGGFGSAGGGASNDVWNSSDGITWTRVTAAAAWAPRTFHTSLVYNNKMWVIGGSNPTALTYYRDVWSSTDGITWTLSTDTPSWVARGYHMSVVFQGKMWVIGGLVTTGTIADAWYSTEGSNWVLATDTLPFGFRSRGAMMVYGGKIWMMGGNGSSAVGQNDVWNSADGVTWSQVTAAAAWPARNFHTGLVYNNAMWIMGGQRPNSALLNDVWYSTDGAAWTQATASADWSPRYVLSSTVFKNKMWIFGGFATGIGTNPGPEVWYSGVATLRGLVLDATTTGAIECASVHLSNGSIDRVGFADANGEFRVDDIPNGSYTLETYAPGYAKTTRAIEITTPSVYYQNVLLTASSAAGSVSGRVTDTNSGAPLPGVKVSVTGAPAGNLVTLTCADGRYQIDHVVSAKSTTVTLQFAAANYTTQTAQVTVSPDTGAQKDVAMAKSAVFPGALVGNVYVANSITAINGAQVTITGGVAMTTTTDNFGAFQFAALPEDHYTVTASAPGYSGDTQTTDVLGTSSAVVDLNLTPVSGSVKGDINGDHVVDAVDIQLVINQALGIQTELDCDINKDGAVDAVDIQMTINAALGVGK